MDNYLLLKIIHGASTLAFFAGLGGFAWYGWRAWRGGSAEQVSSSLRRILLLGVPLLILSAVALPVSGWWLVDLVGWPLGQMWLLGSAVLYLFGCIAWLLLFGRLSRLREQALAEGGPASAQARRSLKFGAAYATVGLVLFGAVLALMIAKPL